MAKNIEINLQHIESIVVVEKEEHGWYWYNPPYKAKWFWESDSNEFFKLRFDGDYSREEIDESRNMIAEGNELFFRGHLKIRMVSGKVHKIYFDSMDDVQQQINTLKAGVPEFLWNKIFI